MSREVDEILGRLSKEKYVVYGAGRFGHKFMKIMSKHGLDKNFLQFVTTEGDYKNGLLSLEDIRKDCLIIVAVHEENAFQMEIILKQKGYRNYISIYPYFTELCCGEPIKKGVIYKTKDIVRKCYARNYIAIIKLAIDNIIGKNEVGKKLYIQMMQLTSDRNTAYKRWNALERMTMDFSKGIIKPFIIEVLGEPLVVIDGHHRVMLSDCFEIGIVMADVYSVDMAWFDEIYHQTVYSDENISKIFAKTDFNLIKAVEL